MDLKHKSKSILCTGHPDKRLASGIAKEFGNKVDFVSRSTPKSLNLADRREQKKLAELSLQYDVFINNSFVDDFSQVFIAKEVWTIWKTNKKRGHIINVGSSVEDLVRPDNRLYSIGKKALRDYSKNLYLYSIWHDSGIKCTHISFGGIKTDKTLSIWPHFSHLDIEYCAKKLKEVIDTPWDINIDRVQISPIQKKDKKILKRENPHPALQEGEFLVSE